MDKKKGLFTGWREVFSFTAEQSVKGGGYKSSTIIVGLILAVAFSLISILMAVFQNDDSEGKVDVDKGFTDKISTVYLMDSNVFEDELLKNLVLTSMTLEGAVEKKVNVELIEVSEKANKLETDVDTIVVELVNTEDKNYVFNAYTNDMSESSADVAEEYLEYVTTYIDVFGYQIAGVSEENMMYFVAPFWTQASSVDDTAQSVGVMLTEMLVPMLFSLLIYALTLLHGQSVTKSVVAEKSSKLMEMMLTSVRPYALISGKVLAVAAMAILQMGIWIICGVGGYLIGGVVADMINPDYINYVDEIINVMVIDNGAGAFSIMSIIIAILTIMVGFLMYCVIAGLVAASVNKMEDISTAMSMFQLPIIVGWMAAYFAPFVDNTIFTKLVHLVPITSPFIMPADVILGRCSIVEGIISFILLVVTTVVLILITGKVYKGKIFNRR